MNEPTLTLDQALQTIDNVLSKFQGTRQDHILIQNSFNLVVSILKPQEGKAEKQPEKPEEPK